LKGAEGKAKKQEPSGSKLEEALRKCKLASAEENKKTKKREEKKKRLKKKRKKR